MAVLIYLREASICICLSNYHLMLINNGMTLDLITDFYKEALTVILVEKNRYHVPCLCIICLMCCLFFKIHVDYEPH